MNSLQKDIQQLVNKTPFVDTHEHLVEEELRVSGDFLQTLWPPFRSSKDFSILLTQYFNSDLHSAGLPESEKHRFYSPDLAPREKWLLVKPFSIM